MRKILQALNPKVEENNRQSGITGFVSDLEVLKKRSKKYLDIIAGMDTEVLKDTNGVNKLIAVIQEEFGTAGLADYPLGIVSKCFLGHPYEVHTLDLSGTQIVKHYKIGEQLPDSFEKARTLAKHNAYALVEVYKNRIVLIREDGTATKI